MADDREAVQESVTPPEEMLVTPPTYDDVLVNDRMEESVSQLLP